MTQESIGQLVRRYRRDAELTQEALAERAGISVRALQGIEAGSKHRPRTDTLQLLLEALAVPEAERAAFLPAAHHVLPDRGEETLERLPAPVRVIQVAPDGEVPQSLQAFQPTHPTNLPEERTRFIGREREIAEVVALMCDPHIRLVTLTGPGGAGKTRLALQVGNAFRSDFRDGVFFVDLAPLAHPSLVPSAVAAALNVSEVADQTLMARLVDVLRAKHLLLVLDNFEHVLPAGDEISRLLISCPHLKVLVTSRAVLHLVAEHEYPIPPLATPAPGHLPDLAILSTYDAIRLFVQRAEAVKPSFELTEENAPAVARICSHLDGLPLAIELAAARVKLFPPGALLIRLSSGLTLLTGGARDAPTRQQTLRNTIDWSYALLSENEQRLLARLAVFAGGWSFEAAEAICANDGDLDVMQSLGGLVDQSLVRMEGEDEPRFFMLETVREYAQEKLEDSGERDGLRQRHAMWYLALVDDAEHELRGPQRAQWARYLEREHANLRVALQWTRDNGHVELGLRLAIAMSLFWKMRGHLTEGQNWLTDLLAAGSDAAPLLRARALLKTGELVFARGRAQEAAELFERSLGLHRAIDERQGRVEALGRLADALVNQGNEERVVALLEEYVALGRQQGDRALLASALYRLAKRATWHNDAARARLLGEECLPLFRELDDVSGTLHALQIVAFAAYRDGEVIQARALTDEVIALLPRSDLDEDMRVSDELQLLWAARDQGDYAQVRRLWEALEARALELGDMWSAAYARMFLATFVVEQGEYDEARALAQKSLAVFQEAEDRRGTGRALVALGDVARAQGDAEGMIGPCERALALFQEIGETYLPATALHNLALAARCRGDYERAETLLSETLTIYRQSARAWRVAEVLWSVGLVALEQVQLERAREAFSESLMTARTWTLGVTLDGLASVAVKQEQPERAARLFGAAEVIRTTMGTPVSPANQLLYQRHVSLTREALGVQSFARAWEAGRAMTLEQAIACALEPGEQKSHWRKPGR